MLQQIETVIILTTTALQLQNKARLSFPNQQTRGNVIGPLAATSWSDAAQCWQLKLSDNKRSLGASHYTSPEAAADSEPTPKSSDLWPAFGGSNDGTAAFLEATSVDKSPNMGYSYSYLALPITSLITTRAPPSRA